VIFVDTSFFVGFVAARDSRNREAIDIAGVHSAERFLTTNHICGETWTFLGKRVGHRGALRFLDDVEESPRYEVLRVTAAQEESAWTWLRRHDEREYSFVDATSFMVMKDLGISDAFAFDGDFTAAGFHELRAEA